MAIILEKDKIKRGQIVQYPSSVSKNNLLKEFAGIYLEGYIVGSSLLPLSANTITIDLANAFNGSTSEIFHNGPIMPSYTPFSGSMDIVSEYGKYEPNLLNIITIKYVDNNSIKITYNRNITQEDVTGDKHFVHVQGPPQTIWTVTHNLNKKPSLTVIDSSGNMVVGKLTYVNLNILTIQFVSPISGEAICN